MRSCLLTLTILISFSFPLMAKKKNLFPEIENYSQAAIVDNGHTLLKSSLSYNVPLPPEFQETEKFTEEDFLKMVNRNHPDIIKAKLDRQKALYKRVEAQGAFDPSVSSDNFYRRFNSSSAVGDTQKAFTSNTSIDWLSGYGAKFSVGAKFAEGDIKTPISPTGDGGEYFVKAQIPLLRNAIFNEKNVKEQQAKIQETIFDLELYEKRLQTLSKAAYSYWNWIGSFKKLEAQEELLRLNQNQAQQAQDQVTYGILPQIGKVELDREVQKTQGKVWDSIIGYKDKAIKFTSFLWRENGESYPIVSSDNLPEMQLEIDSYQEPEVHEAKLNALENRPEFKSITRFKEVARWNRKFAKNQYLPELDLYGYQGIEVGAGSIGPTTEAGVQILLPFRNRKASGLLNQAKINISKLNVQEKQLAQAIFLEIENTAQILENSYKAFETAKKEVEFATLLAQGEKDKFDLGASTIFLVIRRQRSLIDAKINLITSYVDYNIAKANYNFAQGLLPE